MKKNLQRFGASVLAAAMVAQSVALPAAAETTKIDSSVAQSVAASAASAASAVQSLPKFTSTADLIKQTAQTLAAQGEVHELEQDDAKLEATAQSKAGMSLAALENALADAMYANAAAGKINTEAYGLNKDEMASVMAATIKTYHLSSAVTDLGYETNAAGVVTAVTFTGSSGMTSAMESMTNSDDEVIAQQADSYAQAYVAENSDTFAASAAADGHTYGEPKWYWNDTNPEDGHTHTWKETPDGYWTKTDDGWAYTAVYTCEKDDAYQKVEGTVTKDTTEAKPGVAGKTVYSASVPADKSPVKKEYKEPTTRTDDIAALPCQNHAVPKDADGNFVATFNWEMKKVEGELAARTAEQIARMQAESGGFFLAVGDGNHSLATAKACWEAIKPTLSDEARVDHPARFALCELVNLHSPALIFRPVHRVVFGAEIDALQSGFERYLRAHGMTLADGGEVTLVQDGARRGFAIQGRGDRLPVDVLQKYLDQACGERSGWSLDYVHGDADAAGLAQSGATAALLGAMDKRALFPAIAAGGVLPRKTFSMGEATEKRYYMECRRIDAKNP